MSAFNSMVTVARKELLDLFRDRRTVMLGLLMMPILFPAMILSLGSMAEKKARTQLESTLALPVIGAEHAPNLVRHLQTLNIEPKPAPKAADGDVRAQEFDVVLRIAPDFDEPWR